MNNLSKEMNNEGNNETVIATSNDNYEVKIDKNYKLSNKNANEESHFVKKFKNSIFGTDIGIKSSGFSSVAGLALVIAITVIFVLYLLWRF